MNSLEYLSDVVIIGGGLAGLVTSFKLLDQNKRVLLLERDTEENLGGLAKLSFGGVMFVDTPHQRRLGIKDSQELAFSDWCSYAEFEGEGGNGKKWARTYVDRSKDLIFPWLVDRKIEFLPLVNWTERGMFIKGNSLPRWHIAWGTGAEIIRCILKDLFKHKNISNLKIEYGHKVDDIILENSNVIGCSGVIEKNNTPFIAKAKSTVISSGGICGGNLQKVKENWYKPWSGIPKTILNGSHQYADGILMDAVKKKGGSIKNLDKQWHYAAGVHHPQATMENHGLSLVPPRSALWVNALGERFGTLPLVGYTDTRYFVEEICKSPGQYSWQIMNYTIAKKELAVSGSEYMTAFKNKSKFKLLKDLIFGNTELVNRLIKESKDFVVADSLPELVKKMNQLENSYLVNYNTLNNVVQSYDDEIERGESYFNDEQLRRIMNFRKYRGDKIRICKYQKIIDKKAMPLIAIREFILSRKSLGGIETDLQCRVLNTSGEPIHGLYAVGESAGFGGGGIHGKRSLEGTFLGSCVLTGLIAGEVIGS